MVEITEQNEDYLSLISNFFLSFFDGYSCEERNDEGKDDMKML